MSNHLSHANQPHRVNSNSIPTEAHSAYTSKEVTIEPNEAIDDLFSEFDEESDVLFAVSPPRSDDAAEMNELELSRRRAASPDESRHMAQMQERSMSEMFGTSTNTAMLSSLAPDQTVDLEAVTAAAIALESQLDQAGALSKSAIRDAMQSLIQRCQELPHDLQQEATVRVERGMYALRQRTAKLTRIFKQCTSMDEVFSQAAYALQRMMKSDRVMIYRFDSEEQGKVVMESRLPEWTPALGEALPALCFGLRSKTDYQQQPVVAIADIRQYQMSAYQLQLLKRFQVEASLTYPIRVNDQLWGLMIVHQCSHARRWSEFDLAMLAEVTQELTLYIQPVMAQQQQQRWIEQNQVLTAIVNQMYRSSDIDSVFRIATEEVRRQVKCDRVAIYRFNPDWTGEFIAESVGAGWKPLMQEQYDNPVLRQNINECSVKDLANNVPLVPDTHLRDSNGGRFSRGEPYRVCNDVYNSGFSQCYIRMLERYQARAYVMVAIYEEGNLWGLLAVYQCQGARQWSSAEVGMLSQVGTQLNIALQQAGQTVQLTEAVKRERAIAQLVERIRKQSTLEEIFRTLTLEIRNLLQCDRVGIYQFEEDWSGQFVAESASADWTSLLELQSRDPRIVKNVNDCSVRDLVTPTNRRTTDTHLKETNGGAYARGEVYRVAYDIYNAGFSPCYIDVLETYQARAYIIVGIYQQDRLWGLLAAYQNSGPRQWKDNEIELMARISNPLGIAIQQAESTRQLSEVVKRERALGKLVPRILNSTDEASMFRLATQEVRNILMCDRVGVYRFTPDWSGEFVAESVGSGWVPLVGPDIKTVWEDTHLQDTQGGRYAKQESFVVNDIYAVGHSPCHVEILEQFQVKAYMIAPIFYQDKLWGLLGAYQNSDIRNWQQEEIQVLNQVGIQIGVALQQIAFTRELTETAVRTEAVNKLSNRIGQRIIQQIQRSETASSVFKLVTKELRRQLGSDRVAIYQFNPDWSGDFVCEDFDPQYPKLVGTDLQRVEDTYLQETQGGRYRNGESLKVDNIYTVGHEDCHIELLESWEAKAYMLAPIFKSDTLWGIIGAYQNDGPRRWQDYEVDLLAQMGVLVGIAVQQAESQAQLRRQSEELAANAARDKADKEYLQQQIIQMLSAVRPALDGDLTVRAPVTEDMVGTIADAYNNTIQSLRQLVAQVKVAANKVSNTSEGSQVAIAQMTSQTDQELDEISQALSQIQAMVSGAQSVATSAQQVESAVQRANQTVQTGNVAMNRTVEGIQSIRETVAEATRKLKRLGESSQKISKVVSLISHFTTQTNLLAINAAIEATRAGEFGRGFAVVADEVRSLAQQSAEATTDIEKLVQDIQTEVSSVSSAMDAGIQQVVQGSESVNETQQNLNAIIDATTQISNLMAGITQATQAQTLQSESVVQIMNRLTKTAQNTSSSASNISTSFQELLLTSKDLEAGINRFKVE